MYEFADLYDLIHAELTEDIPFVLDLARQANGSVLELGCGTGRLLRPLFEQGYDVFGIDNSAEMIHKIPSQIHTLHASMTTFDLAPKTFSLAVLSHNTIHHLTEAEIKATCQRIAAHLKQDGLFLLDCANPFMLAEIETTDGFELERQLHDPDGNTIDQLSRYEANHDKQNVRVEWLFRQGNDEVATETVYHYTHPHILQAIMTPIGFVWDAVYGDYEGNEFDEMSDRLLIIARLTKSLA